MRRLGKHGLIGYALLLLLDGDYIIYAVNI